MEKDAVTVSPDEFKALHQALHARCDHRTCNLRIPPPWMGDGLEVKRTEMISVVGTERGNAMADGATMVVDWSR